MNKPLYDVEMTSVFRKESVLKQNLSDFRGEVFVYNLVSSCFLEFSNSSCVIIPFCSIS